MNTTQIEWTDKSWNPVTGCDPVSEGCEHCYAKRMAEGRLRGRCGYDREEPFRVTLHPKRLDQPLKMRKPRVIFVCSMGDLFHKDVPADFIINIFEVMQAAKQHKFIVLTKRPERIESVLYGEEGRWFLGGGDYIPNVALGVSVENQNHIDRVSTLLKIPAAYHVVSVEPMLGPIDIPDAESNYFPICLDWVICGGETGPGARPMNPDWVRSLRDQCTEAGTPFFFKSWGDWAPDWGGGDHIIYNDGYVLKENHEHPDVWKHHLAHTINKMGKKRSGRLLDGREWNGRPW